MNKICIRFERLCVCMRMQIFTHTYACACMYTGVLVPRFMLCMHTLSDYLIYALHAYIICTYVCVYKCICTHVCIKAFMCAPESYSCEEK